MINARQTWCLDASNLLWSNDELWHHKANIFRLIALKIISTRDDFINFKIHQHTTHHRPATPQLPKPHRNPTSICMQDAWRFNSEFFFYTVHSQLWVFIPFRRKTLFLSLTPETHLKLFSCQQVAEVLCDSNSKVQQSFNDNAMALSRLSIIKLLELVSHVSRVKKHYWTWRFADDSFFQSLKIHFFCGIVVCFIIRPESI